mmetsp:Transcript_5896/g.13982  ORF Transcript_5896/g.13982 Transcript_5896/m.13982 type:complete len:389 (-) Transcript_5896:175-1341(-)|eukprot:CAMPEP_0171092212 /NCGR_PEP_ID=MMETSP0766_2-20121228/35558_1 /TAXON_ID=439317 /ORGANISM="Gambierdiscus australes, Strain CAWD 149" /LENGTH=388 /DNA_ID=CAMNT_0011550419 /DNA_START=114 /DNA_END=1280 /DNA_ORIENTATION=+
MGCCSSSPPDQSASNVGVPQPRRRLSVGHVSGNGEETSGDILEDDRGLISALELKDIVEMLPQDIVNERKMSIGSTQDLGKTSFAVKSFKTIGDEVDPQAHCLGYTCRKGLKPESPNQDSWFVLKVDKRFSMYAVFDGHGQKGHDVSNFVKENLPKLMIKDSRFKTDQMNAMLVDCFKKTQSLVGTADRCKKLSAQMSGTTATVVVHDHEGNKLTVAHVADSSAVLGKFKDADRKEMEALQLTRDHKPNLKDERQRIEKNGGRVVFDGYANHRIYAKNARYPGLNMSRCLGDLMGHQDCGITAEPEVSELKISPEDHVLLVCSDGVWEFITPLEAVNIVAEHSPAKAMSAADRLAKEAWDRWIREEGGAVVDDITVVLVFLNQDGNSK